MVEKIINYFYYFIKKISLKIFDQKNPKFFLLFYKENQFENCVRETQFFFILFKPPKSIRMRILFSEYISQNSPCESPILIFFLKRRIKPGEYFFQNFDRSNTFFLILFEKKTLANTLGANTFKKNNISDYINGEYFSKYGMRRCKILLESGIKT